MSVPMFTFFAGCIAGLGCIWDPPGKFCAGAGKRQDLKTWTIINTRLQNVPLQIFGHSWSVQVVAFGSKFKWTVSNGTKVWRKTSRFACTTLLMDWLVCNELFQPCCSYKPLDLTLFIETDTKQLCLLAVFYLSSTKSDWKVIVNKCSFCAACNRRNWWHCAVSQ